MSKVKSVFACQTCGHHTTKWLGRCPDCGGWNTFAEELQAARCPGSVGEKEIVELTKARTPPNPDVAPLDLVPQGGQDSAFIGPAIGGAVSLPKRAQALGETRVRQQLGQGPSPRGVEVTEKG